MLLLGGQINGVTICSATSHVDLKETGCLLLIREYTCLADPFLTVRVCVVPWICCLLGSMGRPVFGLSDSSPALKFKIPPKLLIDFLVKHNTKEENQHLEV